MHIRDVEIEDEREIFIWRNDKLSREMSINSELLSYSDHKFWLNKIIKDPCIDFFIGIDKDLKIGVVRFNFDITKNFAELSININPKYRGKGLGKKLLLKLISKYLYKKN